MTDMTRSGGGMTEGGHGDRATSGGERSRRKSLRLQVCVVAPTSCTSHCHPERNGDPVILNGTKWSEGSVKDSSLTLRMTGRDKTLSFNVLSISGMLLSLPRVSGRVGVRGVGEISLAAGTPFRFRRARASAFRLRSA